MRLPRPPHTPSRGESAYLWRLAGLAAAFIVFTAPPLFHTPERAYPGLTIVFAGLLMAVALIWDRVAVEPDRPVAIGRRRLLLATGMSVIGLAYVANGWVAEMLLHPYGAVMLIVIRGAGHMQRSGRNPYFTYPDSFAATWNLVLPYGPMLSAPYLAPQILRQDLCEVILVGNFSAPVV